MEYKKVLDSLYKPCPHSHSVRFQSFTEPSSKSLLPDALPPQYQRPYTLILEVNDVLMHRNYEVEQSPAIKDALITTGHLQRGYGWKYQKRPGVDALLVKLFDLYEIVTFTSENAFVGVEKYYHHLHSFTHHTNVPIHNDMHIHSLMYHMTLHTHTQFRLVIQ